MSYTDMPVYKNVDAAIQRVADEIAESASPDPALVDALANLIASAAKRSQTHLNVRKFRTDSGNLEWATR